MRKDSVEYIYRPGEIFNNFGDDMNYNYNYVLEKKIYKFHTVCGTILRIKVQMDTLLMFYTVMAVITVI